MANSRESKVDILHHADSRDKDRGEREPLYSTRTGHMERTMFVVDLSRLKAEGDTLENALVLYRPESSIKMQQTEQRCSQLVGMALCTMNFTGNYPEFLRLKGVGYAIRALGDHFLMGLSSRIDEPPASVTNHLKNVHDFFQFYYQSPANVMKKSCQNDWEIFNHTMSQIFHYILKYLALDQHSVPVMLNPLPYLNTQHCGKNAPRLYLLASRVLRACQQHQSIVGGCIFHNSKILTSQFEPMLTEKLALVGGGGIELNRLSILEDDIAPNKVWVLEVFLSTNELDSASYSRKDHIAFQAAYASLDTNPHLTTSALNWRFQVNSSGSGSVANSMGSSGSAGGNSSRTKQHGNWRNRTMAAKSSHKKSSSPSQIKTSHTTPDLASCAANGVDSTQQPVATSTPESRRISGDAIKMNVAEGSVSYSPSASTRMEHSKSDSPTTPISPTTSNKDIDPVAGNKKQQEQELYLDAMEDIDPTMLPPLQQQPSTSTTTTANTTTDTDRPVSSPTGRNTSRPTSTSSEGFSTPPPTPSKDNKTSLAIPFKFPSDRVGAGSELSSASFTTACESLLEQGGGDEQDGDGDDGGNSDTLTRDTSKTGDRGLTDLNDEEIEKIVNAPIATASTDLNQRPLSIVSGGASGSRVPAYPTQLRSWKFKSEPVVESDDESDFVSSTELQELIMESKMMKDSDLPPKTHRTTTAPPQRLVPPPLPPRNTPKMRVVSHPREEGLNHEDAPPRPPKPEELRDKRLKNDPDYEEIDNCINSNEGDAPEITTANTDEVGSAEHTVLNGLPDDGRVGQKQSTDVEKVVIPNGILSDSDEHKTTPKETHTETAENKTEPKTETNNSDKSDSSEATPVLLSCASEAAPTAQDEHHEPNDSTIKENGVIPQHSDEETKLNGVCSPSEVVTDDKDTQHKPNLDSRGKQEESVQEESSNQRKQDENSQGDTQTESGDGNDKDTPVDVEEVNVMLPNETQEEETENTLTEDDRNGDIQISRSRLPVSESLAGVLHEMGLPLDQVLDTEVDPPSGTVTPVEMTLNDSMLKFTSRMKDDEEGSKLNNSGEYSSAPESIELDGESLLASVEEGSTVSLSKSSTLSGYGVNTGSRPRSRSWLAKTMDRSRSTTQDQSMKSMCLYVQLHMNTMVLLLADPGLHKDHTVLNSLWRSLLPQLLELDAGLKGDRSTQRNTSQSKPQNYSATISNYDRYCEALPNTASFQYRHAVRRAHQEYSKDPSLLQVSLSKEHVRILSQSVHQREVYFQPGRLANIDALAMHGTIEKYAKVKSSLRQQPIGGPKVMFI